MSATTAEAPQSPLALYAVFRVSSSHPLVLDGRDVPGAVQELQDVVSVIGNEGVTVRGWYDMSGMRADTDLMVVLQGSAAEDLQWALRELRRTSILAPLIRTWGRIGLDDDDLLADEPQPWIAVRDAAGPLEPPTVLEAAEISDLAEAVRDPHAEARHAAGDGHTHYIGRLIEPVEIVEVLQ